MKVVTAYPNGVFSWIDLSTPDVNGAKAFYSGLFGWDFVDMPTDMGTNYSTATIEGYSVAGMGPQSPDMAEQGMPPIWTSYINHEDVDGVMAQVAAAGGTVLLPPMDVMGEGRMAMFMDPTGGVAGVWQPMNHIGAQLVNQPNTLVWNELQTRDKNKARAFFEKALGWTFFEDESGYVVCQADGRTQAGIMEMDQNWDPNIPPNWSVYFLVEDINDSAARVKALGGEIFVPPTSAGAMGTFAVVADPQGAVFTIMQFNGPVDSPPGH